MPAVPSQGHDGRGHRTERSVRMHLRCRLLPRSHRSKHLRDVPSGRSVPRPVVCTASAAAVQLHWLWPNRRQLDPPKLHRPICADKLSCGLQHVDDGQGGVGGPAGVPGVRRRTLYPPSRHGRLPDVPAGPCVPRRRRRVPKAARSRMGEERQYLSSYQLPNWLFSCFSLLWYFRCNNAGLPTMWCGVRVYTELVLCGVHCLSTRHVQGFTERFSMPSLPS